MFQQKGFNFPIPCGADVIQIVHIKNSHWIMVSNVVHKENVIRVLIVPCKLLV